MSTPLLEGPEKARRNLKIRVYRLETPHVVFGEDYAEYFDGLSHAGAAKIFEGPLPVMNGRKFEYTDKSVKTGTVYAYWVSSTRGDPPAGPLPVKVRDPEVWWPAEKLQARVAALAKVHPHLVKLRACGRTVRGRRLTGIVAGVTGPTLALVGAVHPGESGPELMVPALERLLEEDRALLAKVRVAALPSVCLDERERLAQGNPWYLRLNANGVDLNRNFDADWDRVEKAYGYISSDPDALTYRGRAAGSEPETAAVATFLHKADPAAVFSYHWLASIAGCGFLAPKIADGDKEYDARARALVTAYTRGFQGDRRKTDRPRYLCTVGSLPTWCYRHGGIPCFDVEGSRKRPVEESAATDKTTRTMLHEYQQRHYRGIVSVLELLAQ